jgi:GNAT superfamily N-acetyltransferase
MNKADILARLDHERRNVVSPGTTREVFSHLTRTTSPYHAIGWSALTDDNADSIIAYEVDHHRRLGVQFEWKLYSHDTPGDMLMRLQRHGFEIGEREAVLVYDLSQPPQWMNDGSTKNVMQIERLDQIPIYRNLIGEDFDEFHEMIIADLADAIRSGSTHHRIYIAYDGSTPVSSGRLYTHAESWFAGLYGGGTLPAFRGRGHYRALVAARARAALASGARFLQVDALPTSRPILERLGFQHLTDTWPCDWHP